MKDPHFVTFSPAFHWTDQKIRVHAFYCVLALTIASLLQRHLDHQGIAMSISEILESLNDVKEVALFYNRSQKNPQVTVELTEMDDVQQQLFEALNLTQFRP